MKKKYKIGIIPGDGIGREVTAAARNVLETLNTLSDTYVLEFLDLDAGESAVEKYGDPFPKEVRDEIARADASVFGAAGGKNATFVIGGMRRGLDLYAKVCPIKSLPGTNTLQPDLDILLIRENTEGLFSRAGYIHGDQYVNLRIFTRHGMDRIIRFCFELALKEGRKKVTFTQKDIVLQYTDLPMKEMFYEIAGEYSAVEADDIRVDAFAMDLVMNRGSFDIVLTENSNGDILSDMGAGLTGGLGLAPSGNFGESTAVFEPVHGSAPKHAGKNKANPIATIMSAKMMLDYLGESSSARRIEEAVKDILVEGKIRTYDLGGSSSTQEVADAVCGKITEK
ncbi:isocitrate/isopropylmalate dehydrogenase family protein [Thermodesulfobacteriota bacterium]